MKSVLGRHIGCHHGNGNFVVVKFGSYEFLDPYRFWYFIFNDNIIITGDINETPWGAATPLSVRGRSKNLSDDGGLTLEIPSSFDQRKHPRGSFWPLLISLPISPKRLGLSYVCLRDTFRGILEGYFGEKLFVLGQSSAKLWHEM